jgi:hypothetical protein
VKELRGIAYGIGRAIVMLVLAIWFIASCAGAYGALFVFWPFISVCFLSVWAVWRVTGHGNGVGGVALQRGVGPARQRLLRHSYLSPGRRVLATSDPSFSLELAMPLWYEAANAILWVPFLLQGPLLVAAQLCWLASQEQPRVVIEWSWLAIGLMLVAGLVTGAVAFVSYAARQFVAPGMIGRRFRIPLFGLALVTAHRDVIAVEIRRGIELPDHTAIHHVRFVRTSGESVDVAFGEMTPVGAQPADELVALGTLLARTARVPLRVPNENSAELGTRVSTT